MIVHTISSCSLGRWQRLAAMLVVMLVLVYALPTSQVSPTQLRLQPQLLAFAARHPSDRVSVIVQKLRHDVRVEALVAQLGGTVTKDIAIINAFAADLPASALGRLGTDPGVRWISLDASVVKTAATCSGCVDTTALANAYTSAIGADKLWNEAPKYLQGAGVTVAVLDSGVASNSDFITPSHGAYRVVANAKFNSTTLNPNDQYGHGTHIAGIIGGNGTRSQGQFIGVAPRVKLINVKVSDDNGAAKMSDIAIGMGWILQNRQLYNIRVVNLSMNSSEAESYHTSPLSAAAEILWFSGIVVVTSAGNNGTANLYAPANDPFVITVGATDDKGTATIADDTIAPFSAYGVTADSVVKPDIVAPGTNITGPLASNNTRLAREHSDHKVMTRNGKPYYFRMSGTSMAAPMVAGAAALLLQSEPNLTPDQVKYRLMATAIHDTTRWPNYEAMRAGAGYLDIYTAVHTPTSESANTGLSASRLLWDGSEPITWNSVNWGSVNWGSVNWGSVNWGSVNWGSTYWEN